MCTSKLSKTSSFNKVHSSYYVENFIINSTFHESLSRISFFLDPRGENSMNYSASISLSACLFGLSIVFLQNQSQKLSNSQGKVRPSSVLKSYEAVCFEKLIVWGFWTKNAQNFCRKVLQVVLKFDGRNFCFFLHEAPGT